MTRKFRFAAFHLALAAMMLRALLPAGWMPDPAGGAAFVLCTLDGAVQPAHHAPATPDDGRQQQECPFAAAPHVAAPVAALALLAPSYQFAFVPLMAADRVRVRTAQYAPHAPRAPPQAG